MSYHICILGIDGSGKSTIAGLLPPALSAEFKAIVACAGDNLQLVNGKKKYTSLLSHSIDIPLAGQLCRYFKRKSKKYADNRKIYPIFKLLHLFYQDVAAQKLEKKYSPVIIVSDGNFLLSSLGRAANYLQPASENKALSDNSQMVNSDDLKSILEYIVDKKPLPENTRNLIPKNKKVDFIIKFLHLTVADKLLLPDLLIFMDIMPEIALDRIKIRGKKIDLHENIYDLSQARHMYLKTIDAFNAYRSNISASSISVDDHTPQQILANLIKLIKQEIMQKT